MATPIKFSRFAKLGVLALVVLTALLFLTHTASASDEPNTCMDAVGQDVSC